MDTKCANLCYIWAFRVSNYRLQTIGTRLQCQRMDATVEEIIGLKKTITPKYIGFKSGQ